MLTTTNTTNLSNNAVAGTQPSLIPGMELRGRLYFALNSNTFTGVAVSTDGSMIGNVTGRFYGAPLAAGTSSKVAGSPPEIGGTFALLGGGAFQGSFGGM
jgi:hypothetical protein